MYLSDLLLQSSSPSPFSSSHPGRQSHVPSQTSLACKQLPLLHVYWAAEQAKIWRQWNTYNHNLL